MQQKFWSDLSKQEQEKIIVRLECGDSRKTIAEEYSLHYESFARTMRRVFAKRAPAQNIQATNVSPYNAPHLSIYIVDDENPNNRSLFLNPSFKVNIIFFTDAHFPYHDQRATDAFLRACSVLDHDIIISGGDILDLYGLSKYGKDPHQLLAKNIKIEKRCFVEFAESLNEISPHSEKLGIWGNHMHRYTLWLADNPSFSSMEELSMDNMLELRRLRWHKHVGEILFDADPGSIVFPKPSLVFHHGTISRKHSGASSRAESESFGYVSSVSGHVHRLSVAYKRTINGQILMAEGGTLRDLRADYIYRPDWQNGFLYMTYCPGGQIYCSPVLIHNGLAYYNGKQI